MKFVLSVSIEEKSVENHPNLDDYCLFTIIFQIWMICRCHKASIFGTRPYLDNALPAVLMATGFGLDPLEFAAVEGPETDGLVGVWGG